MARSADQVADAARAYSQRGTLFASDLSPLTGGMCQMFTRTCAGAPSGAPDASGAWRAARYRHTRGTAPRGALVYWLGGSRGHGHAAVSEGGGYVWSTDIKREARVDLVSIAYLSARWSNLDYQGWSEDTNGVRISGLTVAASVDESLVVSLAQMAPGRSGSDVRDLQYALRRAGMAAYNPSGVTGYFGDETRKMVAAFQRKQGWSGSDADGLPGPVTLQRLGLHVR